MARRLLGLPAGNQLELAAVVNQAGLTSEQTELLVSLWQKTSDPAVRRFVLTEPRQALYNARPELVTAPDPRLSEAGRRIARALAILRGVALRLIQALRNPPPSSELALLEPEMERTAEVLPETLEALGSARKCVGDAVSNGPSATPTSGGS